MERLHFFGYTLYHLDYHNPELKVDLPLLFRFTSAARHDSVNGLVALHELRKHAPDISIGSVCLDSANDNSSATFWRDGWSTVL